MQPKQILIVDDDPHIRKTLVDILRVKGFEPEAVASGKHAIESATRTQPAIVLLDLRLEDMSGLEVMKQVKQLSPTSDCILLTGYASQNSAIEAVNLGAYSYLQKPYDLEQLLLVIRRAIEKQTAELEVSEYRAHLETLVEQRTAELMHAKELAEAAQAKAEAASLAKSRFLANMSHELRTPLNAVLGYAQLLKLETNLTEKQRENLGTIQKSGEHLLTLITDVLDISKIEAGKLELDAQDFYLPGLLNSLVDMTRIRTDLKSLTFDAFVDKDLPHMVSGDEKRLRQVLLNLLGNAVKFTPEGSIRLRVTGLKQTGDRRPIRFEVEDTGVGIPSARLQEIFEPFQQVGDSRLKREGTGLGLAISRQLVRRMGGELAVESRLNAGTRFSFTIALPGAQAALKTASPSRWRHVTGYQGPTRRILVVDDKATNIRLLADMLRPLHFDILTAFNGKEALETASRLRPDAILMDAVMPEMDGISATRRLRGDASTRDMIVIMLSASAFELDREQSLAAGCHDFLAKPVSRDDLLEALGRHLALQWEYEESSAAKPAPSEEAIDYPAHETLMTLLSLAQRGTPRGILEWLTEFEREHETYQVFVTTIRNMAQGFEMEGICALLETQLDAKEK